MPKVFNKADLLALESMKRFSHDPHKQVVAQIAVFGGNLIIGVNRFTDGMLVYPHMYERPMKYVWMIHAEQDAIAKAARMGMSLEGASMLCTSFPCADCAKVIVQSGIRKIYTIEPDFEHERWGHSFSNAEKMLTMAGVKIHIIGDEPVAPMIH